MAVREGAALGVLAGEPDVHVLGEQRGKRQRFRVTELDPALLERLAALAKRLAKLAVDSEAVGNSKQLLV